MSWYAWLPFAAFGVASVWCFASSYRHLRPELGRRAGRLALRGALVPQNLFTERGWRLRRLGGIWACCALGVLLMAALLGG